TKYAGQGIEMAGAKLKDGSQYLNTWATNSLRKEEYRDLYFAEPYTFSEKMQLQRQNQELRKQILENKISELKKLTEEAITEDTMDGYYNLLKTFRKSIEELVKLKGNEDNANNFLARMTGAEFKKESIRLEKNDQKGEQDHKQNEKRIKQLEAKNGDGQHQIDELKEEAEELKNIIKKCQKNCKNEKRIMDTKGQFKITDKEKLKTNSLFTIVPATEKSAEHISKLYKTIDYLQEIINKLEAENRNLQERLNKYEPIPEKMKKIEELGEKIKELERKLDKACQHGNEMDDCGECLEPKGEIEGAECDRCGKCLKPSDLKKQRAKNRTVKNNIPTYSDQGIPTPPPTPPLKPVKDNISLTDPENIRNPNFNPHIGKVKELQQQVKFHANQAQTYLINLQKLTAENDLLEEKVKKGVNYQLAQALKEANEKIRELEAGINKSNTLINVKDETISLYEEIINELGGKKGANNQKHRSQIFSRLLASNLPSKKIKEKIDHTPEQLSRERHENKQNAQKELKNKEAEITILKSQVTELGGTAGANPSEKLIESKLREVVVAKD
ncbi:10313_t:CDS:2, partial [Racocetra fulgida]